MIRGQVKGENRGSQQPKNAQHLKVIERCRCRGSWVVQFVKEEDVEDRRQGQTPEYPYVFRSPDIWISGLK